MPEDMPMQLMDPDHLDILSEEAKVSYTGVDLLQKIISGDFPHPPVSAISGQRLVEVEAGRVVWETSPPENFLNPWGSVHGGWAMTVLDSAAACAIHSALPIGKALTTLELKTNLTRAPKVGEVYRCEGKMLSLGRRVGASEAKMTDKDGRIIAFATTTCLVLELENP